MGKRVLVICTSPHMKGNSEILADEFVRGAAEAGNIVEKICLYDKNIGFCRGCLACQSTKTCVIKDDASVIVNEIKNAEAVAFATPIYFYEMTGQMKTLLDRCNPLFVSDYGFRDVYLLATAADTEKSAMDGAVKGLQGFIDCFEKSRLAGVVRGIGAKRHGSIRQAPAVLKEAYEMGKLV